MTPLTVTYRRELLALLRRVEEDAFAHAEEELEVGLRSVAVPVRGYDDQVLATVNVATHTGHAGTDDFIEAVLPAMRAAGGAIHHDLTAEGPYRRQILM